MSQKAWIFGNIATRTLNFVTLLNTADPHHHPHHIFPITAPTVSWVYPDCGLPWPIQSLQANAGSIQQNLNVWGFNLPWPLILIPLFRPSKPGSDESGCEHVACELVSPLSCYCTDHSQLSHALSFTNWHWVLLYSVTPLHMYCFPSLCCNWRNSSIFNWLPSNFWQGWSTNTNHLYEIASLATVQCILHFQEVSVFYYKYIFLSIFNAGISQVLGTK